jgi:N6-L-threonylcarbamoyladenine synthase
LSKGPGHFEKVGETQDDALGEAYDKVARLLNLPYPGGPEMDRLAKIGREKGVEPLDFPRPMIHSKDLNFSFSGLKTHILYLIQKLGNLPEEMKIRIATEFEKSILDVLTLKTKNAVEEYGSVSLIVGGGASSNLFLKENFERIANKMQLDLYYSTRELATDNALMIALTCANQIENGHAPTKEFLAVGSKDYKWSH